MQLVVYPALQKLAQVYSLLMQAACVTDADSALATTEENQQRGMQEALHRQMVRVNLRYCMTDNNCRTPTAAKVCVRVCVSTLTAQQYRTLGACDRHLLLGCPGHAALRLCVGSWCSALADAQVGPQHACHDAALRCAAAGGPSGPQGGDNQKHSRGGGKGGRAAREWGTGL